MWHSGMEASQQVLESYLDHCGCSGGKASPVHIYGLQDQGVFGGFLKRENFIGAPEAKKRHLLKLWVFRIAELLLGVQQLASVA